MVAPKGSCGAGAALGFAARGGAALDGAKGSAAPAKGLCGASTVLIRWSRRAAASRARGRSAGRSGPGDGLPRELEAGDDLRVLTARELEAAAPDDRGEEAIGVEDQRVGAELDRRHGVGAAGAALCQRARATAEGRRVCTRGSVGCMPSSTIHSSPRRRAIC